MSQIKPHQKPQQVRSHSRERSSEEPKYTISSATELGKEGFTVQGAILVGEARIILEEPLDAAKSREVKIQGKSSHTVHRHLAKVSEEAHSNENFDEVILKFVKRFGFLGVETFQVHKWVVLEDQKGFEHGRSIYLFGRGESVHTFMREAHLINALVYGLDELLSSSVEDSSKLRECIQRVTSAVDSLWLKKPRLRISDDVRTSRDHLRRLITCAIQDKMERLGTLQIDVQTGIVGVSSRSLLGRAYMALFDELYRFRPLSRKCKWCGDFFELSRKDRVFCSKSCENSFLRFEKRLRSSG